MNEREKLIELINQVRGNEVALANYEADIIIDHLLANGIIVPPYKVGDIVWRIEDVWHLDDQETWTYHYEKEVVEFMIRSISISCNSKGKWTKKIRICEVRDGKVIDHQHNIEFDEAGKTVFLSREEAETALNEIKK